MDDARKPVVGLGGEDFSLKDGGARQPVLDSEPATGPMTIAIAVWGFSAEERDPLGVAVNAFVTAIHESSSFSRSILVLDRDQGDPESGRLLSGIHVGGMAVAFAGHRASVDVFNAALRGVRDAGSGDRRLIVAFLRGSSAGDVGPIADLSVDLIANKTSLWTVEIPTAGQTGAAGSPGATTDDALDAAVQAAGGSRWRVETLADLEPGARGVASLLGTAQYFVTVSLPALFSGPVPIATRHDRGVVLVPMWSR